jgi:hypothetical protein
MQAAHAVMHAHRTCKCAAEGGADCPAFKAAAKTLAALALADKGAAAQGRALGTPRAFGPRKDGELARAAIAAINGN